NKRRQYEPEGIMTDMGGQFHSMTYTQSEGQGGKWSQDSGSPSGGIGGSGEKLDYEGKGPEHGYGGPRPDKFPNELRNWNCGNDVTSMLSTMAAARSISDPQALARASNLIGSKASQVRTGGWASTSYLPWTPPGTGETIIKDTPLKNIIQETDDIIAPGLGKKFKDSPASDLGYATGHLWAPRWMDADLTSSTAPSTSKWVPCANQLEQCKCKGSVRAKVRDSTAAPNTPLYSSIIRYVHGSIPCTNEGFIGQVSSDIEIVQCECLSNDDVAQVATQPIAAHQYPVNRTVFEEAVWPGLFDVTNYTRYGPKAYNATGTENDRLYNVNWVYKHIPAENPNTKFSIFDINQAGRGISGNTCSPALVGTECDNQTANPMYDTKCWTRQGRFSNPICICGNCVSSNISAAGGRPERKWTRTSPPAVHVDIPTGWWLYPPVPDRKFASDSYNYDINQVSSEREDSNYIMPIYKPGSWKDWGAYAAPYDTSGYGGFGQLGSGIGGSTSLVIYGECVAPSSSSGEGCAITCNKRDKGKYNCGPGVDGAAGWVLVNPNSCNGNVKECSALLDTSFKDGSWQRPRASIHASDADGGLRMPGITDIYPACRSGDLGRGKCGRGHEFPAQSIGAAQSFYDGSAYISAHNFYPLLKTTQGQACGQKVIEYFQDQNGINLSGYMGVYDVNGNPVLGETRAGSGPLNAMQPVDRLPNPLYLEKRQKKNGITVVPSYKRLPDEWSGSGWQQTMRMWPDAGVTQYISLGAPAGKWGDPAGEDVNSCANTWHSPLNDTEGVWCSGSKKANARPYSFRELINSPRNVLTGSGCGAQKGPDPSGSGLNNIKGRNQWYQRWNIGKCSEDAARNLLAATWYKSTGPASKGWGYGLQQNWDSEKNGSMPPAFHYCNLNSKDEKCYQDELFENEFGNPFVGFPQCGCAGVERANNDQYINQDYPGSLMGGKNNNSAHSSVPSPAHKAMMPRGAYNFAINNNDAYIGVQNRNNWWAANSSSDRDISRNACTNVYIPNFGGDMKPFCSFAFNGVRKSPSGALGENEPFGNTSTCLDAREISLPNLSDANQQGPPSYFGAMSSAELRSGNPTHALPTYLCPRNKGFTGNANSSDDNDDNRLPWGNTKPMEINHAPRWAWGCPSCSEKCNRDDVKNQNNPSNRPMGTGIIGPQDSGKCCSRPSNMAVMPQPDDVIGVTEKNSYALKPNDVEKVSGPKGNLTEESANLRELDAKEISAALLCNYWAWNPEGTCKYRMSGNYIGPDSPAVALQPPSDANLLCTSASWAPACRDLPPTFISTSPTSMPNASSGMNTIPFNLQDKPPLRMKKVSENKYGGNKLTNY
ncbi:hypothetical protein OAK19_05930, partial [Aureispira]|nr:hypothetical protein [Aureispira sp.]